MIDRQQKQQIINDLKIKMVFLVGPRQVGKTFLAKNIGENYKKTTYLNYDSFEDREIIIKQQWPNDTDLLILDEIHKMKQWKNYLKGVYDTKEKNLKILVTGSARLEEFRQAGDSLAGRYFIHRLLPLSLAELINEKNKSYDLNRLLKRGGFPEPFLAQANVDALRWRNHYIDSLIRTDILNFDRIHDFKSIKLVLELLRRKVGSPISYNSIARDVAISPITVKKYIEIFKALFIVFSVSPFSKKISRSILKETKIYFYDNGLVIGEEGIILENLVAVSLFKNILAQNDSLGKNLDLQYLRTKDGLEVDFAISENENLIELIEVKLSDNKLSKNLKYFSEKYLVAGNQLLKNIKQEKSISKLNIVKAENYLKSLYL
jgi:uncharacterized protein